MREGSFHHRHLRLGRLLLAPEPDRGDPARRREDFHDPDLPPRHALVAFHLWLREGGTHALLHMGAHGTLEWLPGKPLAPGPDCFPSLLAGGTPVIYPFISSNPGEAAGAKRRLGAVTIGHLPPPLRDAGLHGEAAALERLLDEYAAADGLDRRRTALLRREVLERAAACGLLREIGAPPDASDEDALARLDAFLCDVKVLRVSDGLHVLGVAPAPPRRAALLQALGAGEGSPVAAALDGSAPAELDAVLDALDGRFVPAGPSGCPASGRADVLPTGRNLHTVDPRAVPTPAAETLAVRAAEDLLARHLQSHGDWPRRLVLDLWGGSTMRTGGEDLALALHLLGTRPVRDPASARVTGVEAVPLAELDRPRVDVTLRISGLFRDAFPAQVALFDAAVRMIAARDEASDWNPLAAAARGLSGAALRRATTRIFGAPPGAYGAGLAALLATGSWRDRDELAHAWLAASAAAYGQDLDGAAAPDALRERVAAADCLRAPPGPRRHRRPRRPGRRRARGRLRRGRRPARREPRAVARGRHPPGGARQPHHRRGGPPRHPRPRRQPPLARWHDAPRPPRRRGDGPRAGRPARLRRHAARAPGPAVRPAARRHPRRPRRGRLPARRQPGGPRRHGRPLRRGPGARALAAPPQRPRRRAGGVMASAGRKASGSFLKKRTKKRLFPELGAWATFRAETGKVFLLLFLQKKKVLPCFACSRPSRLAP